MPKFGDTPEFSGQSLCITCRCAHTITGLRFKDALTVCHNVGETMRVPQPVVTCSAYDDARNPPIWQLEKIAWRISADAKKNAAGFNAGGRIYNPQEWKARVQQGKETDPDD